MVKRRVVTYVDESVLLKLTQMKDAGKGSVYKQVERFILEGIERVEQGGALEGGTGQAGEGVRGEDRSAGERDWREVFNPRRAPEEYFKRKRRGG